MKTMLTIAAVFMLVLGTVVLAKVTAWSQYGKPVASVGSTGRIRYEHGDWKNQTKLKEFTLTERSSKLFHSQDMKGKVWVTNFFFSACPTICLQLNTEVKSLQQQYGPREVTFVSITSDPLRDTPSVLSKYAQSLEADPQHWLFLTGEPKHINRIGNDIFGVPIDTEKGDHSPKLIVVGRWGKVRGMFSYNEPLEIAEMKILLDELLAETTPPETETSKE